MRNVLYCREYDWRSALSILIPAARRRLTLVFLLLSYRVMVSTTQDSTVTTILHNATVIHLQTQDLMSNNRKF